MATLELTWFNNPYTIQKLEIGQEYYFQGVVAGGLLRRQMVNPQVRTAAQVSAVPLIPVYPQTDGLNSGAIGRCVAQLLPHAELLGDPLPLPCCKNTACPPRPRPCGTSIPLPPLRPPRRRAAA